ncbi:S8 family serine peptidase [Cohnella sp. LGH]|uniref:S8 family serine peptidase n=1 Tax=Cohnella sp. LGH TaxID=1619153 RepID=UPI001ADC5BA8|nr:S8 family serine peptidase [Cohnella sp. LGH]QTH45393.1 S8 family serine peptidase [Cohnella sp. LGH]
MGTTIRFIAKVIVFFFISTTFLFEYSVFAAQYQDVKEAPRHKTELIVKYKNGAKSQAVHTGIKTKLRLGKLESKHKSNNNRLEVLQIAEGDSLDRTIAELKKDPNVEYAQPNYLLHASAIPQDALFNEQWGLRNEGQSIGYQKGVAGIDINIAPVWDQTLGERSVLVGILDTGIDINHPDLAASLYTNTAEVPGNGIDDDGNGYVDDVHGYDFASGDASVYDSASDDKHGTHVAGIIAAQANTSGIRGVAPGVSLLPLKFMKNGSGYTSDAIEAIEYAKSMGVNILNASFGGPDYNPALKEALAQSEMLVVAAAGNHGMSVDENPIYPASFRLPNLLSVTAIDNQGKLAPFAGYGSTVDVAAPGMGILSTLPGEAYGNQSGTSMAAPFVSGIAALVKSEYPDLTSEQIAGRIKSTTTTAPNLSGKVVTKGWVSASNALTGEVTEPTSQPQPSNENNEQTAGNGGMVVTLAAEVSPTLLEQIHYGEEGVNAATGNYGKSVTDLSVEAPGFMVNISRSYNSKDDRPSSSMGRGWTFGFEGSVKDDTTNPTGLKVVKLPNGGAQVFVKNADGTYTPNDSHSVLVKLADNTHTLTTKDQYMYGFNAAGYLNWMQDRNGNRVNISTDANGKVTKITDTVGRVFNVGYNTNGFLNTVTDPIGRVVKYDYDAQNRLKKVTDPSGLVIANYNYDISNYMTGVLNGTNNLLESITYNHAAGADQHKVTQTTNAFGNVMLYAYDNANRITTIKDLVGLSTIKGYDTAGYVISSQDPEGRISKADYYLDANGYNKFGEEKNVTDRNGNKTQYERDGNGNITKQINPDNTFKTYLYDSKNNLIMEQDELGKRIEYIYDSNKIRLLKKVQPLNGTDVYSEGANADAFAVTSYEYYSDTEAEQLGYKAKGLLHAETDPEGGRTTYTYDVDSNKKTVTDAAGDKTSYEYNGIGWLMAVVSPLGYQTNYTYDKLGRLVKTVDDGGETKFTEYDTLGRVIQSVLPNLYKHEEDATNDSTPSYVYKNNNVGNRFVYESNGLMKTKTDALGYVTQYSYDVYGNLISETKPNGAVYLYQYDVMQRLKRTQFKADVSAVPITLDSTSYKVLTGGFTQKVQITYISDTETAVTTVTYDNLGREKSELRPDGTEVSTEHYANGTVKSTKDARGNSTYFRYDGLNRLTESWLPFESGKYMYKSTTYDRADRNVMEQTGKDLVPLYGMLSGDRVMWSKTSYTSDGLVAESTNSAGGKRLFQYDEEGRLTREDVYASVDESIITEYKYDHRVDPIESKKHVRTGDLVGNDFNDDSDTILLTTFTFDSEDNLLSRTTPDGVTTNLKYDLVGNLLQTTTEGLDENGLPTEIMSSNTYDWAGKPLTSTDANGNVTTFVYDEQGRLTKQTDALAGTTAYGYDRVGRRTMQVSPGNYVVSDSRTEYMYDKMGRVLLIKELFKEKKVAPVTYAWMDTPTELVTRAYLYDENGNVVKELDGEGYLSGTGKTVQARIQSGYGTETTYNAANLPVSVKDAVSAERGLKWTLKNLYDGAGRQIGVIDANGVVKGSRYDDTGRVIAQTVRASLNAAEKVMKSSVYDRAGRVVSETDGNGNITTITYNAFGQTRTTNEPGDDTIAAYSTMNQYDVMGRKARSEDSEGAVTLTAYDPQGKEISKTKQLKDGSQAITTSVRYDKNGNARFMIDGNGKVTEKSYDTLNRLSSTKVSVTDVAGATTQQMISYGYDKNGNKLWEQNWLGNRQTYTYDERNRLVAKTDSANVMVQKLVYNANDAQIATFDALNRLTKYTFDRNNRQLSVTDADNHTTSQSYNNVGLKESQTDGLGNTTRYTYDDLGQLASVVNALGETTSYTYDGNGNMLTQKDGRGKVTSYEYNIANKQTKRIDHGGRTGKAGSYQYDLAKVESYSYNGSGQMKIKLDRNGNTTTYLYDVHNRLVSQTVTGSGLAAKDNQISYTYDNNGNQLSMRDGTGTTSRTYDELNRVITKSVPGMGTSTVLLDQTADLQTGYVSEVTTDPKGNITTKLYDKTNRLYELKDGNTLQASYSYYADGSQQQVTYANGAKEVYTYYPNNLLQTLENYHGTTKLDTYTYTYDLANNQKTKSETVNGVVKGVTSFSYDALNRLQIVTEPNGKKTEYAFDPSGNRLSEKTTQDTVDTIISYNYNDQNRLMGTVEVKLSGETQQVNYAYDNNGNMINKSTEIRKKIDPENPPSPTFGLFIYGQPNPNPRIADVLEGVARYEYNGFNQLVKMSTGNSGASYQYNGDGLRVKKTVDGVSTAYLYEYDKVVMETDGKGKQTARNLYGLNLVSRTMELETYFYLYNGHSDVTALISSSGMVASTYEYDAFGNLKNKTGTVNNPIRYAGYQYDEESKFYYLNARYYDPKLARFLTEDTYRGQANDPLSLNLYTYVHNEPIMYWDPTGYAEVKLRQLAGASGGSIKYDSKTKTASVTLAPGYTVSFNANTKGVSIKDGHFVIDNKLFDQKMTGSQTSKVIPTASQTQTIKAKVDSAVLGNQVAVSTNITKTVTVTQTLSTSSKPVDYIPRVIQTTTVRDTTVVFNKDTDRIVSVSADKAIPDYLKPENSGLTKAQAVLTAVALIDNSISTKERKELELPTNATAVFELSHKAAQQGMSLAQANAVYNQIYGPNLTEIVALGALGKVTAGSRVSAPVEITTRSTTKSAGNAGRQTAKTNLGNEIDITPSTTHTTTTKNPGLKGEPNSSVDIVDANGQIKTRRYFGPDGKATRDVDMTNHGNPKQHPEAPHEHTFEYNPDGSLKSR